jgi:GH15 family glucan-1,4-alpha-glucosidase
MTTIPPKTELGVSELAALAASSAAAIERWQAPSGAYPASPTFPVYRYSWFRDGAFIADAMSRYGRTESTDAFFRWCSDVLLARAERIEALLDDHAAGRQIARERFLPCRYTLDGRDERGEWWDFQLDGYGAWLWALAAHVSRTGTTAEPYAKAVELTVGYLVAFWNEPCYDWWEEHEEHRHTSTLAAIAGGLAAIARTPGVDATVGRRATVEASAIRTACEAEGVVAGRLVKWFGGAALDASLVSCATPFRLFDPFDPVMASTVAALEQSLAHGGVHRYAADTYYGGGEWLLLAALLGWHYVETGRTDDAWAQLRWVAAQAHPNGDLPEQVADHLLAPEREAEWVERWGPSAAPLLWSHAMYLTLATELGLPVGDVAR